MSRITIIEAGGEVPRTDLATWLEEHRLSIRVRKVPDHVSKAFSSPSMPAGGYVAEFEQQIFQEDARGNPHSGVWGSARSAVQDLLGSLRGKLIGAAGPPHITVPEFSGIEEAIAGAASPPKVAETRRYHADLYPLTGFTDSLPSGSRCGHCHRSLYDGHMCVTIHGPTGTTTKVVQ